CCASASQRSRCLRQETRRHSGRGLSRGQTRSFQRRFHVVRRKVHVRPRWFQGGRTSQAASAHCPPQARLSRQCQRRRTTGKADLFALASLTYPTELEEPYETK